jgi:hypothetical protein
MIVKCKKHPKYKAIKKPTADCYACRKIWENNYEGNYEYMVSLGPYWLRNQISPPNQLAIDNSKLILSYFTELNFYPIVGPTTAAEGVCVSLSFENEDGYADVECMNNGEILGVICDRRIKTDSVKVWDVNLSDLGMSLEKIINFIQYGKSQPDVKKV